MFVQNTFGGIKITHATETDNQGNLKSLNAVKNISIMYMEDNRFKKQIMNQVEVLTEAVDFIINYIQNPGGFFSKKKIRRG